MTWPRDRACPEVGEGLYARLKALPPADVQKLDALASPWARLRIKMEWLFGSYMRREPRKGQ